MYRFILLPIDGSDGAVRATHHAAALAVATGATVGILAVMDTGGELAWTPEATAAYARLRTDAQATIEATSRIVVGAGVQLVEHLIIDGVPAVSIAETAAELGADLIVLGANDGGDERRVTAYLLAYARCPVLVVPPPRPM